MPLTQPGHGHRPARRVERPQRRADRDRHRQGHYTNANLPSTGAGTTPMATVGGRLVLVGLVAQALALRRFLPA